MAKLDSEAGNGLVRRRVRDAGASPEDYGKTPVCVITGGSEVSDGISPMNSPLARPPAASRGQQRRSRRAAAELRRITRSGVYTTAIDLTRPSRKKPSPRRWRPTRFMRRYWSTMPHRDWRRAGGAGRRQDRRSMRLNVRSGSALTSHSCPPCCGERGGV